MHGPPIAQAWAMPWKAWNEIGRLLLVPAAAFAWAWSGVAVGAGWRCYGLPIVQRHRQSTIAIGPGCELRSHVRSNPLGPAHAVILSTRAAGAHLHIGPGFGMTGGSIVCERAITIGARVTVGCDSIIADTDFHPLDPAVRALHPTDGAAAPVVIEDDVFIGMRALVLKGAHIGRGCVIAAGAVVTGHIPPGMIAAGVPARVLGPVTSGPVTSGPVTPGMA